MKFEDIHTPIQDFLKDVKAYELQDKNHKLPLSDAVFCAHDIVRNRYFFTSIQQAIKNKNGTTISVVDAGAGVGILGIFALFLGAKSCTFIEENPHTLDVCRKLVGKLGYTEQSNFIKGDASQIQLTNNFDILISETLETTFKQEDFPSIIKHLQPYGKPNYIIIPESFDMQICDTNQELIHSQNISSYNLPDIDILNLPQGYTEIVVDGTVNIYKDISIKSGECVSFFNQRTIKI